MTAPSVVVVGAGIIGAAVAWHLARGGAAVTVVDAEPAGGGRATPRSWAWINASWGHAEPYVRLRMRSMEDWRRLGAAVPGLPLSWCGGLVWDLAPDDLRAFVAERQGQGYDVRLVGREEAARLEPALLDPPTLAAHAPCEGTVEPLEAVQALLADARGARFLYGQPVETLLFAQGRVAGVRLADGAELAADRVVLAAGAATADLAAQAGVVIPLDAPPGLLVSTEPAPRLLNGLVVAPGLELRQLPDGRLLGAGDFAGTDPGEDAEATAAAILATIRAALRGGDALRPRGHTVGHRPVPRDGVSIVGEAAPGLHVAVTHSGVTLAPAIGRMVADEILTGRRDPLLAPFGPERFAA